MGEWASRVARASALSLTDPGSRYDFEQREVCSQTSRALGFTRGDSRTVPQALKSEVAPVLSSIPNRAARYFSLYGCKGQGGSLGLS